MEISQDMKCFMSKMRILLVDDEVELITILASYLGGFFGTVETAHDGLVGLNKFMEHTYDIIVTDISMPVMNGVDMIKAIKKIKKDQSIVVSTAYSNHDFLISFINMKVSSFIQKPSPFSEYRDVLYEISTRIFNKSEVERYKNNLEEIVKQKTDEALQKSEELRSKEERMRLIVENMSKGLAVFEAFESGDDFCFIELNRSAEMMLGISQNGAIGKKITQLFPDVLSSGLYELFVRVWNTGIPEHKTPSLNLYGKKERWFEHYVFKLNSGEIVAIIEDITESMNSRENIVKSEKELRIITDEQNSLIEELKVSKSGAEEMAELLNLYSMEMEQKNQDLLATNKLLKDVQGQMIQQEKLASIGQLAAGVAHEINNPTGFIMSNLRSFKGYIEDLKEIVKSYRELFSCNSYQEVKDKLDQIGELEKELDLDYILEDSEDLAEESIDGANRIKKIVDSLRNYARMGREEEYSDVNINDVVENSLNISWNEIKYVAEVQKELGEIYSVKANAGSLSQVLTNIFVNSAHALQEKRSEEKGVIKVKTWPGQDGIIIEIEDNGPGIPDDVIGKIFDPFFTTKEQGKGTGLGLNISYDIIVNQHKGEISCVSEVGKYTRFTIILPYGQDLGSSNDGFKSS